MTQVLSLLHDTPPRTQRQQRTNLLVLVANIIELNLHQSSTLLEGNYSNLPLLTISQPSVNETLKTRFSKNGKQSETSAKKLHAINGLDQNTSSLILQNQACQHCHPCGNRRRFTAPIRTNYPNRNSTDERALK